MKTTGVLVVVIFAALHGTVSLLRPWCPPGWGRRFSHPTDGWLGTDGDRSDRCSRLTGVPGNLASLACRYPHLHLLQEPTMSHHLDSPASRRDPRLNVTDVYAFDSNDATVLAMIVNSSLAGPERVAGFHPEGRYEFK